MIKILYIVFIFLVIRFAVKAFKKYSEMISSQKNNQKNDDIIDAEYTVVDDNEHK